MKMAMKLDGIRRVVAYRRVSTGEQANEGFSLEGQMSDITTWAKNNNIEIVKWYTDEATSGHLFKRAGFDCMISDLCNEQIDADGAVFYTTSRMGRRVSVTSTAMDELNRRGKVIIAISENLISSDPTSSFVMNMLGCANEYQSAQTSQDVKNRLTDTAMAGYYTGGGVPFGYQTIEVQDIQNKVRKKLVINEDEKSTVLKVFDLASKGVNGKALGVLSIAAKLNEEGLLNRGKKWDRNKINRILRNTTYIGQYPFRKGQPNEILITVPAIIQEVLFDKIADGLTDRQLDNTESKGVRSKTLLTGLLKCSTCGLNLSVELGKNGKYKYYKCTTKKNRGPDSCTCPTFPKDKLDSAIKEILLNNVFTVAHILSTYDELKDICKSISKTDRSELSKKQKKCHKINQRLSTLYNQIGDGVIEMDSSLKQHLSQQRLELKSIETYLKHVKKRKNLIIFKFGKTKAEEFCKTIAEYFKSANEEVLKSLLLASVKEIKVYSDEIIIKGSKHQLIDLASKAKKGTPFEVPSFVTVWR
jgi:DNA invertase Pin-like site-specific DNA recombinase